MAAQATRKDGDASFVRRLDVCAFSDSDTERGLDGLKQVSWPEKRSSLCCPSAQQGFNSNESWMWLKIKQEGQTAGFGPCFHLPGQAILDFRFFQPQPIEGSELLKTRFFSWPEEQLLRFVDAVADGGKAGSTWLCI